MHSNLLQIDQPRILRKIDVRTKPIFIDGQWASERLKGLLASILTRFGKLRPLGRPNVNAVKFFNAVELIALLANREWLDDATKTIGQFWKRKNARRNESCAEDLAIIK